MDDILTRINDILTPKEVKRRIPFSALPASWGLKGKALEIAKANYYYDGVDALLRVAEIESESPEEAFIKKITIGINNNILSDLEGDYARAKTDIEKIEVLVRHGILQEYDGAIKIADLTETPDTIPHQVLVLKAKIEHNRVNAYQGEQEIVRLLHTEDTDEYKLAMLDVELKHHKITQLEHDKETATIKGEPWIDIVDHGYDPEKGPQGVHFVFDWNTHWIAMLNENGYHGSSEEEIVEQWFSSVCMDHLNRFDEPSKVIPLDPSLRT